MTSPSIARSLARIIDEADSLYRASRRREDEEHVRAELAAILITAIAHATREGAADLEDMRKMILTRRNETLADISGCEAAASLLQPCAEVCSSDT